MQNTLHTSANHTPVQIPFVNGPLVESKVCRHLSDVNSMDLNNESVCLLDHGYVSDSLFFKTD